MDNLEDERRLPAVALLTGIAEARRRSCGRCCGATLPDDTRGPTVLTAATATSHSTKGSWAGMVALPLMLLDLEWIALIPVGWGIEATLAVARFTAALPAATLGLSPPAR